MLKSRDRQWKLFQFENLAGGFVPSPTKPNEFASLINMEVQRDGSLKTIYGSRELFSGNLDGSEVLGLFVGSVYPNSTTVIAGTHAPALYAYTWNTELTNLICPVTPVNISGSAVSGGDYWIFCQGMDIDNNTVILACNDVSGLLLWDNGFSDSDFQTVTIPDPDGGIPCAVTMYNGRAVAAIRPNKIYFSERQDPTDWPIDQVIYIDPTIGPITRLVTLPGRLVVIGERGIMSTMNDFDSSLELLEE